jgi:hemoglobin
MDSIPEAADVRAMHAADLGPMRRLLFEFLSGAFGGPSLYMRRPDAKCMFSAHAPFKIGVKERDQWMLCMRGALESLELEDELHRTFAREFFRIADALAKSGR